MSTESPNRRGSSHFRRWGAVYILLVLFFGSWSGQFFAQMAEFNSQAPHFGEQTVGFLGFLKEPDFWSSTFENWQSEWLQLFAQAVLVVGAADYVFRKSTEDLHRVEAKIDLLMEVHGVRLDDQEDVD